MSLFFNKLILNSRVKCCDKLWEQCLFKKGILENSPNWGYKYDLLISLHLWDNNILIASLERRNIVICTVFRMDYHDLFFSFFWCIICLFFPVEFKECFSLYDKKRKGKIEAKDLITVMRCLGTSPTFGEIDRHLQVHKIGTPSRAPHWPWGHLSSLMTDPGGISVV